MERLMEESTFLSVSENGVNENVKWHVGKER